MNGHRPEKVEIGARKLAEHVVHALCVLKWINLLGRSFWIKRVTGYLQALFLKLTAQNCKEKEFIVLPFISVFREAPVYQIYF